MKFLVPALVVVLVVAALGWFLNRRRTRTAPPPVPSGRSARPAPGQIWWASVPFDEGDEAKDRPCLVVRVGPRGAEVLKITSRDQSTRDRYVRLPTKTWDPGADRRSWLETRPLRTIDHDAFRRPAGVCDRRVWSRISRAHRVR
ncbi:type II toxin-antitoxin system PemK/MazF family toxin [Embleya sp. NPDC050493]|uniref:type II toxin-antitoxin system PemK/MazF family toxin n=1 Tax=Embleya sp. NPDC050493 TaxID=3363989 RepID=UPI00378BDF7E